MPTHDTPTRWLTVTVMVACGVVAALQVGKAAIAGPLLQADLGLNLDALGWLTGIFAVLGVLAGIPAGAMVTSAGSRRVLIAGLLALAAGSAMGAASPAYAWLLGSRVIEGAGFLCITVAAPSILQRDDVVRRRSRDAAFSLWSCFMPAGMAIAMLAGPAFNGWRSLWWTSSALALLAALAARLTVPADITRVPWHGPALRRDAARVMTAGAPLLLAMGFALYSLMFFALFSFLPVLLIERMAVSLHTAGALSALACAANIVGNLAAGYLLSRGASRPMLLACAFTAMGAAAWGIFLPVLPDAAAFTLCIAFSAIGGVIPAALLSAAPSVAPAAGLAPIVLGLVMQGNNLGQIVGPVAVGSAINHYGWPAAALIVALAALLALVVSAALRRPACPAPEAS